MTKKIFSIIAMIIVVLSLSACESQLNIEKTGNNYKIDLVLNNTIIQAKESDIALFEANSYTAILEDDKLTVSTNISTTDKEDFFNKVSILKQLIVKINPSLKSQVNSIDITMEDVLNGYSFAGIETINFTVSTGDTDYGTVNVEADMGQPFSLNGQDEKAEKIPVKIPAGLEESVFSIEMLNNSNINEINIVTNDSGDKIVSSVLLTFKEDINPELAEKTLERARTENAVANNRSVSFDFTYDTPDVFNALHNMDLYNLFGGIYNIQIESGGVYNQKGTLTLDSYSNGGIDKVTYLVTSGEKNSPTGVVELQDGGNYSFEYGSINGGKIGVTAIVVVSITIVVGIVVILFKREKR